MAGLWRVAPNLECAILLSTGWHFSHIFVTGKSLWYFRPPWDVQTHFYQATHGGWRLLPANCSKDLGRQCDVVERRLALTQTDLHSNSASLTHQLGDLRQVTALSTHLLATTLKRTCSRCCWRLEVLSYRCESEKHISCSNLDSQHVSSSSPGLCFPNTVGVFFSFRELKRYQMEKAPSELQRCIHETMSLHCT